MLRGLQTCALKGGSLMSGPLLKDPCVVRALSTPPAGSGGDGDSRSRHTPKDNAHKECWPVRLRKIPVGLALFGCKALRIVWCC